jgi:hypothetical protein
MTPFKLINATNDEVQLQFNNLIDEILIMQRKLDVIENILEELLKK